MALRLLSIHDIWRDERPSGWRGEDDEAGCDQGEPALTQGPGILGAQAGAAILEHGRMDEGWRGGKEVARLLGVRRLWGGMVVGTRQTWQ
ncbi:hypothetical protein CYMTET_40589 [Cymbomonas tetramitiformis]|uniref:Uncharacterized protein n=1 Tax=Cymbomonas tetramitiformis TaxID=36881 RepID=A0AAE0C7V8_9CHLO|nr:hypothetical protein CYMTET_40589 [Cymbomonas tetramitiformis]